MLVPRGLRLVSRLEEQLETSFVQTILVPVDGLAGVLRPNMVEARVHVTVGVASEVVADLVLVNLAACFFLQAAVERSQVVAHAAANAALLQAHYLGPVLGSSARGEQAGRARAAHQHLGVDSLDNLILGDFGLSTQPVIATRLGQCARLCRRLGRATRQGGHTSRSGAQTQKRAATHRKLLVAHNRSPSLQALLTEDPALSTRRVVLNLLAFERAPSYGAAAEKPSDESGDSLGISLIRLG